MVLIKDIGNGLEMDGHIISILQQGDPFAIALLVHHDHPAKAKGGNPANDLMGQVL